METTQRRIMPNIRNYDGDYLHENIQKDPDAVVIVPETAYFTLDGEPKAMAVPTGLIGDADSVFEIIDMMKTKK
jgi:hypothetical protein